MLKKLALAAGLATLAFAVPAQANVKLGVLRCSIDGGLGYVIASNKTLDCTYRSSHDGTKEHYTGLVSKLGVDLGKRALRRGGVLVTAVVLGQRAADGEHRDGGKSGDEFQHRADLRQNATRRL